MKRYFRGYIPHVVVLGKNGHALYDAAGEIETERIESLFEKALAAQQQ